MARFLFYDDQIINILLKEEQPSGGAAVQAYGWIQGLLALGHEVYVMTDMSRMGPLKEECAGIKFIPTFDYAKGIRWFRWLYYRIPYLYRTLKKVKPDYLYKGIPSWHSFVIGLICQQLGIRFIQRISNDFLIDERFLKNHSKTHRKFQQMGMQLSDYILCQNEYQFSTLHRQFPNKAVKKIANPIYLQPATAIPGEPRRDYIAWLGLFQYQKNLKLLYQIACLLPQEQFLIAGKKSWDADAETLHYLDKLSDLPNVRFHGFIKRDQVLPFLAKAKYLLNTSHYEGFSNTFLEAMVIGTPILTHAHVNPDSIISNFRLGIVYADAADLVAQLAQMAPAAYARMSANALEYVAARHDYRPLTKELVGFLNCRQATAPV